MAASMEQPLILPAAPASDGSVANAAAAAAYVAPPRTETETNPLTGDGNFSERASRFDTATTPANSPAMQPPRASRLATLLQRFKGFWKVKGTRFVWFCIWAAINVALWGEALHRYIDEPSKFVPVARSFGQLLNFNSALILVPVLRNFLTALRKTFLYTYIPFDGAVTFHRRIGYFIAFCTVMHGGAHYFNYRYLLNASIATSKVAPFPDHISPWEYPYRTLAGVTGHMLVIILIIMVTTAIESVRYMNFNVFWFAHHLFIAFFGLLLAHGPRFWKWFVGPGLLYLIERLVREYRSKKETMILKIRTHPSDVIELQMSKTFEYLPGQYLYLCCPLLSRFEWHPFTISSHPDQEYLSVHIRCVGDWTNGLRDLLAPPGTRRSLNIGKISSPTGTQLMKVDGPFGAASEMVFQFETVMLVAGGIGVTPFASILRTICYKLQARNLKKMHIKRVYFYWISRDYRAFEWFQSMLLELEEELAQLGLDGFVQINIFMTGKLKADEESAVQEVEAEGYDGITGLDTARTVRGRPNWDRIFEGVAQSHPTDRVGLFFCGPRPLATALRKSCVKHSERAHGTQFVFNKEHF